MAKLFAAIVAAIVLLTAGALLLVHRLTEPLPAGAGGAVAPEPSPSGADPGRTPYQGGAEASSPMVAPPSRAMTIPMRNEAPPIQGPPPVELPEDPEERGESLQSIRSQRRAEQLERLNRRNQQRLESGSANSRPPPPQPPPEPDPDR